MNVFNIIDGKLETDENGQPVLLLEKGFLSDTCINAMQELGFGDDLETIASNYNKMVDELADLKSQVTRYTNDYKDQSRKLNMWENYREELERKVRNYETRYLNEVQLNKKNGDALRSQVKELKDLESKNKTIIANRDSKIKKLENEIAQLRSKLDKKTAKDSESAKTIGQVNDKVNKMRGVLDSTTKAVAFVNKELKNMVEQVGMRGDLSPIKINLPDGEILAGMLKPLHVDSRLSERLLKDGVAVSSDRDYCIDVCGDYSSQYFYYTIDGTICSKRCKTYHTEKKVNEAVKAFFEKYKRMKDFSDNNDLIALEHLLSSIKKFQDLEKELKEVLKSK